MRVVFVKIFLFYNTFVNNISRKENTFKRAITLCLVRIKEGKNIF